MAKIDPLGQEKMYIQVVNVVTERIEIGEYSHRLPAERALADEFGVAYQTVRRAMAELRGRGLIITLQGRGTFVTPGSRE